MTRPMTARGLRIRAAYLRERIPEIQQQGKPASAQQMMRDAARCEDLAEKMEKNEGIKPAPARGRPAQSRRPT